MTYFLFLVIKEIDKYEKIFKSFWLSSENIF